MTDLAKGNSKKTTTVQYLNNDIKMP